MKRVGWLMCLGLSALPLFCGCGSESGDPKKLPTVKAGGTATFEGGAPVTNLKVVLVPMTGKGYSPTGNLNEQGKFQLTTYAAGDGAPAGKYKAYFQMAMTGMDAGPPTATGPTAKAPAGKPVMPETIVAKDYLSADKTPLTVEVPEGGKEDIKLENIKPAQK